jgi:iron complex outermembrane receptor protein
LALGERDMLHGSFRHAGVAGTKLGYKLSAEYFQGDDWEFADTTEVGTRDNKSQRAAGELRVDWNPAPASEWTLTGGIAQAINTVDLTTLGGVQLKEWLYPYLQLQTKQGQFHANLLYNTSNSGDTYFLRNGDPLEDESWLSAIQLQHRSKVGKSTNLHYGLDARHTEPRTKTTVNGRNEGNDTMTELGAYLSANSSLVKNVTLVGALRADYHDRISDMTLSPRLGVVYHPTTSQSVRFTYNRAFSSPDATALFMDLRLDSLDPFLPYDVRASSVPKDGFTFTEDGDGSLYMQTPWDGLPPSLPADAAQTWDVLDSLLSLQGVDISQIPAPDASQVGTDLRSLDPDDGTFMPLQPSDVLDVPSPRRVIRNTLEVGYKGILAERAEVSADVYWTHIKDNKGRQRTITPNVFFNQASLEAYLSNYMTPVEAAAIAGEATKIPMGTVSPDQIDGYDILTVTHQVGDYTYSFWGIDLGIEVSLSPKLVLGGDYSFFHDNVIEGVDVVGTVILSVPNHKGAAWIRYRNEQKGWTAGVTGRALDGFLVDSGFYTGEVDAYTVLDLNIGYRLIQVPRMVLSLDATNVFDHRHQEYVGAAEIGRLVMVKLQMDL